MEGWGERETMVASNLITRIQLKQLRFDQLFETHTETKVNAEEEEEEKGNNSQTKSIDHYLKPFV